MVYHRYYIYIYLAHYYFCYTIIMVLTTRSFFEWLRKLVCQQLFFYMSKVLYIICIYFFQRCPVGFVPIQYPKLRLYVLSKCLWLTVLFLYREITFYKQSDLSDLICSTRLQLCLDTANIHISLSFQDLDVKTPGRAPVVISPSFTQLNFVINKQG